MIIDLPKFIESEQPMWIELEKLLDRLEADPGFKMSLDQLQRFHYLYQKACADLARISTFSSEPEMQRYLESLAARAYGEISEERGKTIRFAPVHWLFTTFPAAFQRHIRLFVVALAAMLVGCTFGGLALAFDPDAKEVIVPFSHLTGDPKERVAREERSKGEDLRGQMATFSSYLMTHNIKVSIFTLAAGVAYGFGTLLLLFYNGVILGSVAVDYVLAGELVFLLGWLLPHGSIEIPAILIAGQAGLLLGRTLLGAGGGRAPLRARLRSVSPDLMTLIGGVAVLLVWAGIVEAFLSQYHHPVLPYYLKIAFGTFQLLLLALLLSSTFSKRRKSAA